MNGRLRTIASSIFFAFAIQFVSQMAGQAACADEETSAVVFDAVLVNGEVPGPGLWKVTSVDQTGEHVLWIMGTERMLPKKIQWRSTRVEALIAESQAVIVPGEVKRDTDIGFVESMKSVPHILKIQKNPNDQTLGDVLDYPTYRAWAVLKAKYIGRSKFVEGLRPLYALEKLRDEAYDKLQLTTESVVWPVIRKAARKHRVKIVDPSIKVEFKIDHASKIVAKAAALPLDDGECFRSMLGTFEAELARRIARANAWAVGDMAELAKLNSTRPAQNCGQVLIQAMLHAGDESEKYSAATLIERMRAHAETTEAEVRQGWLTAAKTALANNKSSFAFLPMYELVSDGGRLAALKADGYGVEGPLTN